MISYLQWLNWRAAVSFIAIPVALVLVTFGTTLHGVGPDDSGDLIDLISSFGAVSGLLVGFISGGNGIKALWPPRPHGAVYYTLSLPVSRRVIVVAHVATAALVAVIVNAVALVLGLVMVRFTGIELVPDALAASVLLSEANTIAVVLGLAALATLLPAFWFFVAGLALFGGYSNAVLALASDAAGQVALWRGMAFAAAIAVTGLVLTLRFAPKQDY